MPVASIIAHWMGGWGVAPTPGIIAEIGIDDLIIDEQGQLVTVNQQGHLVVIGAAGAIIVVNEQGQPSSVTKRGHP